MMANLCQKTAFQVRFLKEFGSLATPRRSISGWRLSYLSKANKENTKVGHFRPALTQVRSYQIRDVYEPSPNAPKPARPDYEERMWKALNTFDRFPKGKQLTLDTHFINDLGLDSLDQVELIVAVEWAFRDVHGIPRELPDEIAEKLMTPRQILDYLCETDKVPEKRGEYKIIEDFKF